MSLEQPMPLVLSALVGITLALAVWGFRQARQDTSAATGLADAPHDVLVWMLILSALVVGAFLARVLFSAGF